MAETAKSDSLKCLQCRSNCPFHDLKTTCPVGSKKIILESIFDLGIYIEAEPHHFYLTNIANI